MYEAAKMLRHCACFSGMWRISISLCRGATELAVTATGSTGILLLSFLINLSLYLLMFFLKPSHQSLSLSLSLSRSFFTPSHLLPSVSMFVFGIIIEDHVVVAKRGMFYHSSILFLRFMVWHWEGLLSVCVGGETHTVCAKMTVKETV